MNGMHILEYLHDRGRSIGLEIGANFGKITARAVTVVLRWNTHHRTRRHVSCSSGCRSRWRIKIGRFFWSAAKCLSLKSGTLLIKYLESGCKIGGKKCHQWLERPWQVKISYITLLSGAAYKMFLCGKGLESNISDKYGDSQLPMTLVRLPILQQGALLNVVYKFI